MTRLKAFQVSVHAHTYESHHGISQVNCSPLETDLSSITMSLTVPIIAEPLNELTSPFGIRVYGQQVNAHVSIFTRTPSKRLVAEGQATSSDQRFPLLPGINLKQDMQLYAIQELNGDTSREPTGDLVFGVQAAPRSSPGPVRFRTHIYECGRWVWVLGAIPGATVSVFNLTTRLLGSGPCLEGDARFQLTIPIPHTGVISATQTVPSLPPGKSATHTPDAIPLLQGGRGLPPPDVREPVRGCDGSLFVSKVYDGAQVTISSTAGIAGIAGFDLGSLELIMPAPMREGTQFTVKQEVSLQCERKGLDSKTYTVGPLQPLDPPEVKGPLCAGGFWVTAKTLRPGALVHFTNNSQKCTGLCRKDRTEDDFQLSFPLEAGTITATQEICEVVSGSSVAVPVDKREDNIKACQISPHLFACASNVSVVDLHQPSTIEVCSVVNGNLEAISRPYTSYDSTAVVSVSPFLSEGQVIQIRQWACSDKVILSDKMTVEPAPPLPIPIPATPIYDGEKSVEILHTIAGARVDLLINQNKGQGPWTTIGTTEANNILPTEIGINITLNPGDLLRARQWLCSKSSIPEGGIVQVTSASGPRPFWLIGHNPNTTGDVMLALNLGANAIEPDVNIGDNGQMIISHGSGGNVVELIGYLKDLHTIALAHPQLSLVVFDTKPPSHSPENGLALLMAIREHLTFDLPLNIIISVAKLSGVSMFGQIHSILGSREGLLIDEENRPIEVADYFNSIGTSHVSYGNGSTVIAPVFSPNIRPSIEHAVGMRAGQGSFRFIYMWTNNAQERQREFIRTGVDGIIADLSSGGLGDLSAVVAEAEFANVIRRGTLNDNAMKPPNANYELIIKTGTTGGEGTDAVLSFNVRGQLGSATKSIDSSLNTRMESGDWNYVTIQSPDIGPLIDVTVVGDGSGGFLGLTSPWRVDSIRVMSRKYGVDKTATFGVDVDTSPVTRPLL
jgi:hypothetical protein